MFYDPLFWLFMGVGLLLSMWATFKVKRTFAEFSKYTTRSGLTGADVAQRILRDNGIRDVQVEPVAGSLTDHYDPRSKTLRLSEPIYGGRSMAAFGVAAHEVGHAIQHAQGYAPLKFRSAWVPMVNIGSNLSYIILFIAFMMGGFSNAPFVSFAGVGLFALTTVFTLITLPVEFDASRRALLALEGGGYTTVEEVAGAKKVLDAAALTYVAAFVASLMTLLYWLIRLGAFGGRSQQ